MTLDEFFAGVCQEMGWEATPWRTAVFNYWAGRESPGQLWSVAHNPLATTWYSDETPLNMEFDIGHGPGNWNTLGRTIHVRVYRDPQAGIKATANTLKLSHYENIRRCFRDQRGYQEAVQPKDFKTWIGPDTQYGQAVVDFMNQTTASKQVGGSMELYWQRWPLAPEYMDLITGPFGATAPDPPWTPSRPHMGLDIGVRTGTPVYAPAGGVVSSFTNDGSFGIGVCIKHDSEPVWYSLFAHLSVARVAVGQRVNAGDLIAYSGGTPNVAPHLHWQVCRTNTFPRDLSANRDPLLVPMEDDEMGMTLEEKALVDNLRNRVLRLEQVVAGYGIDTDGDGVADLTGEAAIAYAYQQQWSALLGIGQIRLAIAETSGVTVTDIIGEIRKRLED